MFQSDTHLPQVLTPRHYNSAAQLDQEVTTILLPSWHCVATLAEIPRDGDYLTVDLLGHPVLIWKQDDVPHAFLNVCAHRFCKLTCQERGRAPLLRCQYHGWEFDTEGDTRRIPDAPSFKPLKRGELGLRKLRTETMEQLIFVSLAEEGPTLRDFLGPVHDACAPWFSETWSPVARTRVANEANWKLVIENSLESYHIDCVHPRTFRSRPDAETCAHEIDGGWTSFTTRRKDDRAPFSWAHELLFSWSGATRDEFTFKMYHCYPNIMFTKMGGLFSAVETVVPETLSCTATIARHFCFRGSPGSIRSRILPLLIGTWWKRLAAQVYAEDGQVLAALQQGVRSPQHPGGGIISAREERLHHFQRYIRQAMSRQRT